MLPGHLQLQEKGKGKASQKHIVENVQGRGGVVDGTLVRTRTLDRGVPCLGHGVTKCKRAENSQDPAQSNPDEQALENSFAPVRREESV